MQSHPTTRLGGRSNSNIASVSTRRRRWQDWARAGALGLAAWSASFAPAPPARAENRSLAAALESVRAADLQRHVDVLADDTFEGREAGSRGGRAASIYLHNHLVAAKGFKPAGTEGYFQPFHSGRNVLALYEGSDPRLKHEVILIGGHYDHVGYGTPSNSYGPFGYIHNGADDNASGVAGLLEVLDALQQLPQAPKRSILFAFWDGEEKGLLGSKHWASSPTIDLQRVVYAINVDMIGRLERDRVEVFGCRTAPGLREVTSRANHGGLKLDFLWDMKGDSDHFSFFEKNIPSMMLHTGLHGDYHRPSDDAHKLNYEGMQAVTRLLMELVVAVADQPQVAPFRAESKRESDTTRQQVEAELPPPPSRLGVHFRADGGQGVLVTRVQPGAPAELAGVQAGDRLLSLGDTATDDEEAMRGAVMQAPAATQATVLRAGESEPRTLPLRLLGEPSRLGLSWRDDSAEPGVFAVVRVMPDTPAAKAGVQVGDRIYEFDGRRAGDSRELAEWVRAANGPFQLTLERDGRIREVTVEF